MTRKQGPRIGMSPFYRDYLKAKARNKTKEQGSEKDT